MEKILFDKFKIMIVDDNTTKSINFEFADKGIVLNFTPTSAQKDFIQTFIRDNKVKTLFTLNSAKNVVGFVHNKTFTVFYSRLGNSRISSDIDNAILQKGLSMYWTVKKVLDECSISYISDKNNSDYDLSYENFTFDKLEKLFNI